MLDINLIRPDKGGDPVRAAPPFEVNFFLLFPALTVVDVLLPTTQALVRESERRRYADPAQVDRVIALDQVWRDGASAHTCSWSLAWRPRSQRSYTP